MMRRRRTRRRRTTTTATMMIPDSWFMIHDEDEDEDEDDENLLRAEIVELEFSKSSRYPQRLPGQHRLTSYCMACCETPLFLVEIQSGNMWMWCVLVMKLKPPKIYVLLGLPLKQTCSTPTAHGHDFRCHDFRRWKITSLPTSLGSEVVTRCCGDYLVRPWFGDEMMREGIRPRFCFESRIKDECQDNINDTTV